MSFDHLGAERFVSLVTFRGSGDPVATPVWFAPFDHSLVVGTFRDSGKVKRLRAGSDAQIAACNFRGLVRGPYVDVAAHIMDPGTQFAAAAALEEKYGWQWDMFGRRIDTYLQITERG